MRALLHSVPRPCAGHCRPTPPPETPGHSWASLGQFLVESLLLSPGSWCTQGFVCAFQESVSPVLCKFWWFYGGVGGRWAGGVDGNLLYQGLCHTQVCCTQSLHHCGRPLLVRNPQETLKHPKAALAQSLWSLLVCTRFCLSTPSVSGRYGV